MSHTKVDYDPTSGLNRLRRLRAAGAIIAPLALAGCAEAVEPLQVSDISVHGVELPKELAEVRTQVLEVCNTGEGAAEVRDAWTDLGFEEKTGTKWIDALAFSADFGYDEDPQAVIYGGTYRYPIIQEVAENCIEVAKLSSSAVGTATVEEATATLEEFRELPYDPTTEVLAQIAHNLESAE